MSQPGHDLELSMPQLGHNLATINDNLQVRERFLYLRGWREIEQKFTESFSSFSEQW